MARQWRWGLATLTVRQFCLAVGFALAVLATGCGLYVVETCLIRPEHRFIENPGSVMMRACGLAHFWIGWLFLFTSPRLRSRRALLQLLLLTAMGLALCWLCAQIGSLHHPFMFVFFYSYFLLHEIRDETRLYRTYSGTRDNRHADGAFLHAFSRTVALGMTSLLCGGYLLYGLTVKHHPLLVTIPPVLYGLAVGLAAVATLWLVRRAWQLARRQHGSLREALVIHSPLVVVYGGLIVVLILGMAFGAASFNLIIIIHAGAWLVFIYHQLGQQPVLSSWNPWTWLRRTPTGFLVLHIGLIAVLVVLMALRVHAWERTGLICQLLEGKNFPYWSLMHISMAFWRPR
jgi:hypothetical protein